MAPIGHAALKNKPDRSMKNKRPLGLSIGET
jgi:hypothetical protein